MMNAAIEILSFDGHAILVGSAARRTLFPSDIDLQATIPASNAAAAVRHAVQELVRLPLVRVSDVKAGGRHFTAAQALVAGALEAALQSSERLKVDAIAWDASSARFVEIACLVLRVDHGKVVGEAAPTDLVASLKADIAELSTDGKWWKALKRTASLRTAQGRSTAKLDAVFDGPLGALAQLCQDLKVVTMLCDLRPPLARLLIELNGAAHRISRINVRDLVAQDDALVTQLEAARRDLQGGVEGVHKAGALAGAIGARLNNVVEAAARKVFQKT